MTISIHTQTAFEDYAFFSEKMDAVLAQYPTISKCLTGRSKSTEFAKQYFKDTSIVCEQPKLETFKIQNLFKIVELSDLSIFFCNESIRQGAMLTLKSLSRAKNLEKEFIVIEY